MTSHVIKYLSHWFFLTPPKKEKKYNPMRRSIDNDLRSLISTFVKEHIDYEKSYQMF